MRQANEYICDTEGQQIMMKSDTEEAIRVACEAISPYLGSPIAPEYRPKGECSQMAQQKKQNSHEEGTSTELCIPIVVNVGGHYDVAVPLRFDGCPVLIVFESLPDAEVTIFHKILATAWASA